LWWILDHGGCGGSFVLQWVVTVTVVVVVVVGCYEFLWGSFILF